MNKELGLTDIEQKSGLIESSRLVEVLTSRGIDLGKTPKRTLTYWRETGLIPKPTKMGSKLGTKGYYDTDTIDLITVIRKLQGQGANLGTIKEKMNEGILKMIDKSGYKECFLESCKEYGIDVSASANMWEAVLQLKTKAEAQLKETEAELAKYKKLYTELEQKIKREQEQREPIPCNVR